jgi:hypothetical protein
MPDPIIIKGGSVEIEFDPDVYKPDSNNKKKHSNPNKKITGVEIRDEKGNVVPSVPANGKCTITILCQ